MQEFTIKKRNATFRDPHLEAQYQSEIFETSARNNIWALLIFLTLFGLYGFVDTQILYNPIFAVEIRSFVTIMSLAATLTMLFIPELRRYHEAISGIIVTLMGVAIGLIVLNEPDLTQAYYVSYIQGAVFLCFVLRLNFTIPVLVMSAFMVTFAISSYGKGDTEQFFTQMIVLVTMFAICIVGNYLLQRLRRSDFQLRQMIKNQNAELQNWLDRAEQDRSRKVAVTNLLSHHVRTPIHQIMGFSDIVISSLKHQEQDAASAIDGATYIRDAAIRLGNNLNRLMMYHRLDEVETSNQESQVSLIELLEDIACGLNASSNIDIDTNCKFQMDDNIFKPFVTSVISYYNIEAPECSQIQFRVENKHGQIVLHIVDDGPALECEKFIEDTKPLTELDSYLTSMGADWPLSLRTIDRVCKMAGADFTHHVNNGQNEFIITFDAVWGLRIAA
ncbi:MAG: hypothetical protein ACWA5L_04385 [bacterium]